MDSLRGLAGAFENVYFEKIEDVPLDVFRALEPGDFLFIDTSHVIKVGSELNYILFKLMPAVPRGVMVHVHDLFLPYEYPRWWLEDVNMMWNEQYAWLAFIMCNRDYAITWPVYYNGKARAAALRAKLADFPIWDMYRNLSGLEGGSFWMRRLA